jgi:preprotein translocase subunit SecG
MSFLFNLILTVQLLSALGMIGLILVQHGKGADMGAAFGGGGNSGSLFGASGSANFLSRTTAVLATVFFLCTLGLAYLGSARPADTGSVLERAATGAPAPAAGAASGAAAEIPGSAAPAASGAPAVPATPPAAPAAGASGAAQIPAR